MLLNNKNFQRFNISAFTSLIQCLQYRFFTAFKAVLKLVTVSFVSFHFFLISLSCFHPSVWLPARSFLYLSIVLSSHLSSLVSWYSFLFLFTARQSSPFLKSTSAFCTSYFIFKVCPSSDLEVLYSPHLITHNLSVGYMFWFFRFS